MTDVTHNFEPDEKERNTSLKDNFLKLTPAQAGQWVDDNVNDLASAKLAMKRLVMIVNALAHKVDI